MPNQFPGESNIRKSSLSAYMSSSPKAPFSDPDQVARTKPSTAIVQPVIRPFKLLQQQAASHYKAFAENGEAFLHDHDELKARYKEEGFKTWKDCCLATYGVTDDAIYKRVLKLRVEEQPTEVGYNTTETNQKALKEVDRRSEASKRQESTEDEEEPEKPRVKTADEVKAENAQKNGHVEKPKPLMDKSGCIIPQRLLALYNRREELSKPMHYIAQVRKALEDLQTEDNILLRSIRHNGITQTTAKCASSLYHALRECQPEIVCPECDGKADKKCNECGGSGMISEEKYNRQWVKSSRRERLKVVEERNKANG